VEHGKQLHPPLHTSDHLNTNMAKRVYTPHLPANIPSLRKLVEGKADPPVPIPSSFPQQTPKSETVNSHQIRFSDTAQHEKLHSNIHPDIMKFSQYPFPRSQDAGLKKKYGPDSTYLEGGLIREWVEDIFVQNGHDKLLELNTTVERAEKNGEGKWILTLRKDGPGKNLWWQETFDALVVATGHYNIPWIPDIEGLLEYDEKFEGRVLHSKHFRDGKKFEGKVCSAPLFGNGSESNVMNVACHSRRRLRLFIRNHPRNPSLWHPPSHRIHPRRTTSSIRLRPMDAPPDNHQESHRQIRPGLWQNLFRRRVVC
jgi:hypothetical protein